MTITSAPDRRIRSSVCTTSCCAARRRRRQVVDVAGHEDRVDLVGLGDRGDLGEHRPLLVEPVTALERLADVPVGGVQELHGAHLLSRRGQNGGMSSSGGSRDIRSARGPAAVRRARRLGALRQPGRPGGERELDGERHRDLRLGDEHRAGLGDGGADPLRGGQEAVLGPSRLGRVEAADHPDRRVRHDAPLHLAGGLLRADQDDAERPAALGDVEQHVLDRRAALARRVLVQLVDHREQQPARAGLLLARGLGGEHHADHEALRPLVQVVQVDDGELLVLRGDARGAGRRAGRRG